MGGRIGWRIEFFCLDLDVVLWLGESLRNLVFVKKNLIGGGVKGGHREREEGGGPLGFSQSGAGVDMDMM